MTVERDRRATSTNDAPLVIGLLGELMLTVRVQAAIEAMGYRFRAAESPADLGAMLSRECPAAVVYDLSAAAFPLTQVLSVLQSAAGGPERTVAFFPHVIAQLGRDARQAGLGLVVPRSRFMSEMAALVRTTVEGGYAAGSRPLTGD